jgi:hypothetical protein
MRQPLLPPPHVAAPVAHFCFDPTLFPWFPGFCGSIDCAEDSRVSRSGSAGCWLVFDSRSAGSFVKTA